MEGKRWINSIEAGKSVTKLKNWNIFIQFVILEVISVISETKIINLECLQWQMCLV